MAGWMGLVAVATATASNPVVLNTSIADPHIHIWEGKAFMYSGRDLDPTSVHFEMPDWVGPILSSAPASRPAPTPTPRTTAKPALHLPRLRPG